MKAIRLATALSVSLIMSGCNNSSDSVDTTELLALVADAGLTGDPTTGRNLPEITDPKAHLGKLLFFTKGLSGDNDTACVSCHHPVLGGGDDLALPIGVGAETPDLIGPGRFHSLASTLADGSEFDGGPTVPRNTPTTFNMALWDKVLFLDGRIESLGKTPGVNGDDGLGIRTPDVAFGVADVNAGDNLTTAQARFPVTSSEEMRAFTNLPGGSPSANQTTRTTLAAKLAGDDPLSAALHGDWDAEFNTAYGDPAITYARIAESIAEYERSQIFVNSPWKAFVEGDADAMSESAKRGAMMFFTSINDGGANCVSCHSGDFMTDEEFHVLAVPQIGRGKGNGISGNDDFGRFRETADTADMYQFRTPTLLNVEVTAPFGHAGAHKTLEGIIRHHMDPVAGIANFDFSQLDPNIQAQDMLTLTQLHLDQLAANRLAGVDKVLQNVAMTDTEVADMVEFMKALTDPCVKDRDCLAPWIPTAGEANPDGFRLNGFDNNGIFF